MVLKDSRLINNLLVVRHLLIHVTGKSWQVRQDKLPLQGHAHPTHTHSDWDGLLRAPTHLTCTSWDVAGNWRTWRKPTQMHRQCADPTQTVAPGRNISSFSSYQCYNDWTKCWTKWHYSRTWCIWDSKLICMKHMTEDKEVEYLFAWSNLVRIQCGMLQC